MAGSQPTRRLFRAALAAVLSLLLSPWCAPGAEPAVWALDHAAAAAQARKQGKFLLVVHLSSDFSAREESDQARLYRTLTLADPRVARLLKDRCVATYLHVGASRSVIRSEDAISKPPKAPAPASAAAPTAEVAIAYLCLPDERVLHYVPGFVTADELLAELHWLEEGYTEASTTPDAEAPNFWRERHRACVTRKEWVEFQGLFPSRWKEKELARGSSTVDLPPAIDAARTTLARSLAARLPTGRPSTSLSAHGVLGVEAAHLVLAEFPLISLSDLARPVYENATGQRLWETSPRRKELANWWTDCRHRSVATLLAIKDDSYRMSVYEKSYLPSFAWPPPGAAEFIDPSRLETQFVSLDELAQLVADVGLAPVAYGATDGQPRYLLHDARGFRCAVLMDGEGTVERLGEAIQKAVGPATIKGGGAKE